MSRIKRTSKTDQPKGTEDSLGLGVGVCRLENKGVKIVVFAALSYFSKPETAAWSPLTFPERFHNGGSLREISDLTGQSKKETKKGVFDMGRRGWGWEKTPTEKKVCRNMFGEAHSSRGQQKP